MSEHLQKAIAELEAKLAEQLKAAAKTKSGINQLAELDGLPPPYPEIEEASGGMIRSDHFYGRGVLGSLGLGFIGPISGKDDAERADYLRQILDKFNCGLFVHSPCTDFSLSANSLQCIAS